MVTRKVAKRVASAKRSAKHTDYAFLDIETDWSQRITVIGIYRTGQDPIQWIAPHFPVDEIRNTLRGTKKFFTYNGSRFDLPVILRQLQVDLEKEFRHQDLMFDCWARSLYGGLKRVETALGIHRDTEGVDGRVALILWDRYTKNRDKEALDLLLRYNREDIVNLETLARKLEIIPQ
ncbi:MAG TPA: ribonuclease H-like domain-containing protein [Elusimicrobiota bacterium]|nr:ribonuclease H-like domain-containing protein [Elusimicrobiota bacterium]